MPQMSNFVFPQELYNSGYNATWHWYNSFIHIIKIQNTSSIPKVVHNCKK